MSRHILVHGRVQAVVATEEAEPVPAGFTQLPTA